jgi:hypothetical protein
MSERDPNIVNSGLSRKVTRDGVTVEVSIIRLEHENEWSLEVVNSANTSIVWDELFRPMKPPTPNLSGRLLRRVCKRFSTARR